ncbi:NADH dehydrogenase [ubiquinone] 1 alpha subcomplex subunit 13 [Ctenocephalides felis]|uniref:NADH dehydrogenase [ubiquinone] 1 alpha subcomplex subunit 13 n=1 Tax=Ctenocephalides felis TaxID=7515 RepID=UPI000E6E3E32|nr:NADH dehydrogenase [ubiquinone] 1 alpha subcomplex subunit 13 [Ctenocephalides felis]
MATATATKPQDLPPEGGYKPINFKRVPAKTFFSGITCFGILAGVTCASCYLYLQNWKDVRREKLEMRSGRIALHPLLLAERDREYLKQIRRNRDEEARLMANVKGWEVGKLYNEPVYKTVPKDAFVQPSFTEFYIHADYAAKADRNDLQFWH